MKSVKFRSKRLQRGGNNSIIIHKEQIANKGVYDFEIINFQSKKHLIIKKAPLNLYIGLTITRGHDVNDYENELQTIKNLNNKTVQDFIAEAIKYEYVKLFTSDENIDNRLLETIGKDNPSARESDLRKTSVGGKRKSKRKSRKRKRYRRKTRHY